MFACYRESYFIRRLGPLVSRGGSSELVDDSFVCCSALYVPDWIRSSCQNWRQAGRYRADTE